MKLKTVHIDKLRPFEGNARTHSAEQVEQIRRSMEEFGFVNPVLVDQELTIIAGHGRVMAAKAAGIDEIPCLFVEHLTEEQTRAYIIADNKLAENAGWNREQLREELLWLQGQDFDITLTGFDLTDFEIAEPEIDINEDDYEIDDTPPVSKLGEIYVLGNHRVMCGDSTDRSHVKALTQGEEMDLCVTDPPYNVNVGDKAEMLVKYGGSGNTDKIMNDNMDDESFYEFLRKAYDQMLWALKDGGAFYIFHGESEGYNFRKALRDAGATLRQNLIWVKSSLVLGRQDYQWRHEPILYGWKDGAGHYFTMDRTHTTVIDEAIDIDHLSREELIRLLRETAEAATNSILYEDKPQRNIEHPTMKPVRLCAKLIHHSSRQGDKVIDLFGGSGSTLMACEQLGRKAHLMELDPKYVDVILKRWTEETGQAPKRVREAFK